MTVREFARHHPAEVVDVISSEGCAHLTAKARLQGFLQNRMKLTLSKEKTLITNVRKKYIKFLGFELKLVPGKARKGYAVGESWEGFAFGLPESTSRCIA